ncbi:protein RER1 isoform X1 [Paroedura picta]|uniref:protein RER1 isoform X1 n=2 Tax=Paroedura picta TaxID=143630 RepID=UPI004055EFD4
MRGRGSGLPSPATMSEGDSTGESIHGKPSVVYRFFTRLGQVGLASGVYEFPFFQIYQSWLDKSTPYTAVRWVVTLGLSFIYMIRVYLLQGWYIVTYALGIYHLNLFIAFLSPKVDPSLMEDSDEGPSLPTKQNEEFRPFIRRLPEFKFWHSATKGILVAMTCTFFEAFNVPVFWPILVMYFIMLFCITMKRQIKHMIKYRYIPFTHGKRKYKGKEDMGKTFAS